jgi:capping protein beta
MATSPDPITSSLSIMRRMPPNKIEQNMSGLLNLLPDQTDELLQRVDQPLEEGTCPESGRQYLLCDYNRDGDSYRSPWSNKYDPPLDDGFVPSETLRVMEVEANALYDSYRDQYYEGGTSSVYLWDVEGGAAGSFAGCFLIKKSVSGHKFVSAGGWDSIHVVEVTPKDAENATYKLTSTVILSMGVNKEEVGETNLSGSMTKQSTKTISFHPDTKSHLANVGSMIEDMEIEMRSNMDNLSVQKTREIVNSIRRTGTGPRQASAFTSSLNAAVAKHGTTRKVDG